MSPNAVDIARITALGCRRLGICRYTGIKRGPFDRGGVFLMGKEVWRNTCLMPVGSPMMKIQVSELGDQLILEVEGRLAGVLYPSWNSAGAPPLRSAGQDGPVDLTLAMPGPP